MAAPKNIPPPTVLAEVGSGYEEAGAVPHDDDAERAVLASVLLDNRCLSAIRAIVATRDFFSLRHQKIFRALEYLRTRGAALDLVTLRAELDRTGDLDACGGPAYLAFLVDGHARSANVEHYARMVREKSIRRTMVLAGEELQRMAVDRGSTLEDIEVMLPAQLQTFSLALGTLRDLGGARPLKDFEPARVEYVVKDLLPRKGLAMVYGPGGTGKTYLLLSIVTELLAFRGGDAFSAPPGLFGHPDLSMRLPWRRVAWVSAEETGPVLRQRWDRVLSGLALRSPADVAGDLEFAWAHEGAAPFTLDRTEEFLNAITGQVDVIILDSWTSLVPPALDGRPVEWDRDNFATRRLLNVLRAIAERRNVLIIVVHHTGKASGPRSTTEDPRGPSEHRNSVDALIRLQKRPERRLLVTVQKQREGRDGWDFTLGFIFTGDGVRIRHEERPASGLGATEQTVLAFLRGRGGNASVAEVVHGTELHRSTVQRALTKLRAAGLAVSTPEKDAKGSVVWRVPAGAHEVPSR